MHGGRIDRRRAIGEPAIARLALLGRQHQPTDLGEQRCAVGGVHLDLQRLRQIERAGIDLLARAHGQRRRLAGNQALIDLSRPFQHHAVGGDPLAGRNEQTIAGAKRMRRHLALRAVRLDECGDAALQAEQILRLAPGAHAQRLIEEAPDQQKEQSETAASK